MQSNIDNNVNYMFSFIDRLKNLEAFTTTEGSNSRHRFLFLVILIGFLVNRVYIPLSNTLCSYS